MDQFHYLRGKIKTLPQDNLTINKMAITITVLPLSGTQTNAINVIVILSRASGSWKSNLLRAQRNHSQ